jgi:hypothetical protein
VAGPVTGGQKWAHEPLQLDLVAVSGTNQYSVKPLALVSTVTPPIVAVFRAVLDEPAVGDVAALGELPDPAEPPPDELPHAAATTASAARATAAQPAGARDLLPRITYPLSPGGDRWTPTAAAREGSATAHPAASHR